MSENRIYVASLSDYNAGILHGVHIDVDEDTTADYVLELVEDMLKKSPNMARYPEDVAEEWAIHDYEGFGGVEIHEYDSFERVVAIGATAAEHGDLFTAWVETHGEHYADEFDAEKFLGKYDSDEDWAWEYFSESGWEAELDALRDRMGSQDTGLCVKFDPEEMVMVARSNWNYSFTRLNGETYVFSN